MGRVTVGHLMRTSLLLVAFAACSSPTHTAPPQSPAPKVEPAPLTAAAPATPAPAAEAAAPKETVAVDTPRTTVAGNAFVVPAGWSVRVKGQATIVEAPEADSWIALVDVSAKSAEEANKGVSNVGFGAPPIGLGQVLKITLD